MDHPTRMKAFTALSRLVNAFIRDADGRVVIWQTPNLPVIGWFVFMAASHFAGAGHLKSGFAYLGTAFLFVWAYLEITKGASYFRRVLGAVVLAGIVISHLQ